MLSWLRHICPSIEKVLNRKSRHALRVCSVSTRQDKQKHQGQKHIPARLQKLKEKRIRHAIVTKMHFFLAARALWIPDHATPNTDTISPIAAPLTAALKFFQKHKSIKKNRSIRRNEQDLVIFLPRVSPFLPQYGRTQD
jgi:hypothetical protein